MVRSSSLLWASERFIFRIGKLRRLVGKLAKPKKGPADSLWAQMYHLFTLNEAEFNRHYHKRSNVETVFHMIKAKFGDKVRSKTPTAQVNEALMKVLCHNICVLIRAMHELGITPVFDEERF